MSRDIDQELGYRGEIEDHLADTARRLTEQRDRCAAEADALEAEGLDAMAERLLRETKLRSMDFRNGMSMEIEPARALAANFVGAARAMLGDAENYSETPVEMTTSLSVDPENPATWEKFAFTVQRVAPGKLTPHEARRKAEAERDRLRLAWESARRGRAEARDERDLLRETLAETDLGQIVQVQWEAIADADTKRDLLESERDEMAARLDAAWTVVREGTANMRAQLATVRAERDQLAAAVQRVRELCARGPGPSNEYQIWTVDVLAALDGEPAGEVDRG